MTTEKKKVVFDLGDGKCLFGMAFITDRSYTGDGAPEKGLLEDHNDGVLVSTMCIKTLLAKNPVFSWEEDSEWYSLKHSLRSFKGSL